jgi:6,7-dimethyl-8-ribityllumazine synthase
VGDPGDERREWPFQDFAGELRRSEEAAGPGEGRAPDPLTQPFPWQTDAGVEVEAPPAEVEPFEAAAVPEAPPEPAPPEPAPPDQHAGGEFRVPDGYEVLEGGPDGGRRAVGVVVARFNAEITTQLLERALATLDEAGVARDAVVVMPVPGAFELPLAAMALARTRRYACIVALGCVIRGETSHFDYVAGEAASGLQLAAIETGVPIAFGLLTCDTREQAIARVDRGADAARTALEMADLFARLRAVAR